MGVGEVFVGGFEVYVCINLQYIKVWMVFGKGFQKVKGYVMFFFYYVNGFVLFEQGSGFCFYLGFEFGVGFVDVCECSFIYRQFFFQLFDVVGGIWLEFLRMMELGFVGLLYK